MSCGRRSMWIFCMKMVRQVENVRIWFFRSIMMRRWRIRLREFCLRSIMAQGPITRQCFYSKELDFAEYDSLFDMAVVMDKLEVLVDMSFGRLCHPWQLSKKAKKQYEDYIRGNLKDIGEFLVESGSLNGLELLSREKLWNREGLEHSIDVASGKKDMEISAFLMNERSRMQKEEQKVAGETENERCPVKRRKKFQL